MTIFFQILSIILAAFCVLQVAWTSISYKFEEWRGLRDIKNMVKPSTLQMLEKKGADPESAPLIYNHDETNSKL